MRFKICENWRNFFFILMKQVKKYKTHWVMEKWTELLTWSPLLSWVLKKKVFNFKLTEQILSSLLIEAIESKRTKQKLLFVFFSLFIFIRHTILFSFQYFLIVLNFFLPLFCVDVVYLFYAKWRKLCFWSKIKKKLPTIEKHKLRTN